MLLYFTRHGQTEWNEVERMQGAKDSPLTRKGVHQAEALHAWLNALPLDRVYASPQPRAFQTAQIALSGRDVPLIPDARLCEASLGALEGMTFRDASAQYPDTMAAFVNAPDRFVPVGENGETFFDVRARVQDFLSELATAGDSRVLVVSHALVLLTMRTVMLGIGLDKLREGVYVPACCRCEAEYADGRWALRRFGEPISPQYAPKGGHPF